MKSFSAANRLAFVFLNALTWIRLTVVGLASLTVTRWSGPALYAVPASWSPDAGRGVVEQELRRQPGVLAGGR